MKHHQEHKPEHGERDGRHHDEKEISVVVNGREKAIRDEELTFRQLVALAFDDPPAGEFICFTITYRRAAGRKPEGTLIEDESVKVREGTIFNVTVTDKS